MKVLVLVLALLLGVGFSTSGAVEIAIFPASAEDISESDLAALAPLRGSYDGNDLTVQMIVQALPAPESAAALKAISVENVETLALTVEYLRGEHAMGDITENILYKNALVMFSLIENLEKVTLRVYDYPDAASAETSLTAWLITREDMRALLELSDWDDVWSGNDFSYDAMQTLFDKLHKMFGKNL